mmetsp:Transcript_49128/g.92095  ORF Transcript_49128/g.92095 Transcript_49128/m.92095 type:complete len:204 (-) Transcript_49128:35-646(-)
MSDSRNPVLCGLRRCVWTGCSQPKTSCKASDNSAWRSALRTASASCWQSSSSSSCGSHCGNSFKPRIWKARCRQGSLPGLGASIHSQSSSSELVPSASKEAVDAVDVVEPGSSSSSMQEDEERIALPRFTNLSNAGSRAALSGAAVAAVLRLAEPAACRVASLRTCRSISGRRWNASQIRRMASSTWKPPSLTWTDQPSPCRR